MPDTAAAEAVPADLVIQAPDIATPQIKYLACLAAAGSISALTAAETQAFRLSPAHNRAAAAELCARAGIDFGFVPGDQRLDRVRPMAIDMDSTLISVERVDELADLCRVKPETAAITASAMRVARSISAPA